MQLPLKQLRQDGAATDQVLTWDSGLSQWVPKTAPGGGGGTDATAETLTYTDTANKVAGPLAYTPAAIAAVSLFVITGAVQSYTMDYTVRLVIGGSAPGYYLCLSPTSTPPGGGSFSGGSNPGSGISGTLTSGDYLRVLYAH